MQGWLGMLDMFLHCARTVSSQTSYLYVNHFCFLYLKCWHEMEARLAGPCPSPESDREKKFQQGTV